MWSGHYLVRLAESILTKTNQRQDGTFRRRRKTFGAHKLLGARITLEVLEDRTLLSSTTSITPTALDAYVAAPDPSYHYSLNSVIYSTGYTDYIIDMTSQTWRSPSEVNITAWRHWLQVIIPSTVSSTTAVLRIQGGSNASAPPTTADAFGVQTATTLDAITAVLPMVPSEPLVFAGETSPRSEDQIIAYTFNQYLNGGDQNWPLLLPMVKSAVRAMDTVQSFVGAISGGTTHVNDFIVTGASKRGWTTWLTPAVDSRVRAIVPWVFDILNSPVNVPHLKDTYVGITQNIVGGYPVAVQDYTNFNVFDRLLTPQGQALTQIVDPYQYIGRPAYTLPKYMVVSTGDQFFVPDSAQFYFHNLPGQNNYIRYVPNTGHGLNSDAAAGSINFEKALLDGVQLPRFSWTVTDFGTTIDVTTIDAPATVNMWEAINPINRDFRVDSFGPNWTSSILTDQGGGHFVAHVSVPATGAIAFMVELTYNVDGVQLTFTTQVSTVPLFVPNVVALAAGGTYTGNPFTATGTATGVAGFPLSGNFTFTYYAGNTVNGTGSSTPPTAAGTYTVVASFTSANPAYVNGQSLPVTFTITTADTTATVTSSANPSVFGDSVTFTAALGASGADVGTASGTVTFRDGTTTLGTAALSGGTASFSTSTLAVGSHAIAVDYGGDSNFNTSTSGALTQTVNSPGTPPTPTPTLTSLSSTSAIEGAADLTLTLTGTLFGATSQVQWNGTPLATTLVSSTQLLATIPAVNLVEDGVIAITVSNPGSSGGISNAQSFTVADAPITAAGLTVRATQGTSFTATVAMLSDANPAADASDFTADIAWGDGQTSTGTVTASSPGNFTITGTHTYNADGRYLVLVTVVDAGGSQTNATTLAHVATIGPAPSCLTDAASAFTHSREYFSLLVTAEYQRYLGRVPDPQGLAGWVAAMQNGLTDERLEAGFTGSPEYIQNHGGLGAGWIQSLYQDQLNRTPTTQEVSGWLTRLSNGMSPADIASMFAASPEREVIRVRADYQTYLGRTPSPTEVSGWVARLESSLLTNEDIVAIMVGSTEYFQGHFNNVADWIFSTYQDVLGRNPDDFGYAAWLTRLRNC
jgi:PhoPQ-activated pathogenicity-related protein